MNCEEKVVKFIEKNTSADKMAMNVHLNAITDSRYFGMLVALILVLIDALGFNIKTIAWTAMSIATLELAIKDCYMLSYKKSFWRIIRFIAIGAMLLFSVLMVIGMVFYYERLFIV